MPQNKTSITGLLTYVAAIGVGTLIFHLSQQMEHTAKVKPFLIYFTPTITIVFSLIFRLIFDNIDSHFYGKYYVAKKERFKIGYEQAMSNPHYTDEEKAEFKKLMFEFEKSELKRQQHILNRIEIT